MKLNLHRILRTAAEPALPTGHFNPSRSGQVFTEEQEKPWEGFSGEDQGLWKQSGIKSPEEAQEWIEAGVIDPKEVGDYKRAGFDPFTILPWVIEFSKFLQGDKLKRTLIEWHKAGWEDPGDASEWYSQGYFKDKPVDALLWYQAGWQNDVDAAGQWHRKPTWQDDPVLAWEWFQKGYTPDEARGQ